MKYISGLLRKIFTLFEIETCNIPFGRSHFVFLKNSRMFRSLLEQAQGHTITGNVRCFVIYELARYAANMEGEIAEVGVYKGGTAKIIAKTCPGKKVHLFDTFSGMPKTQKLEKHMEGGFSDTSIESVRSFLSDCDNVVFHPGFFPKTAETLNNVKFCLVNIDVDIYSSAKDCLEFFYTKMVPGGIMIFDDWEWKMCPGIKKALIEYLSDKKEKPIITTRNQCIVIKS